MNEKILTPYVKTFLLEDDGRIPNNPHLPLLVYKNGLSLSANNAAEICEQIISENQWGNSWRNSIFAFHHYHSTAHEVLTIAAGSARVQFGGGKGPELEVESGDVVVIPAGVGHKNLGASPDFLVVGAYPPGQTWDLCRGEPEERPLALENIAQVLLPPTDPIYGENGPLIKHWSTP